MHSSLLKIVAAATVALFAAAPTWADNPGKHPAYLHALSDLRDARAHLEHLSSDPVDREEEHAIANIDKAIAEIKHAAIKDGKDIQDHAPVDAHLVRSGRFHKDAGDCWIRPSRMSPVKKTSRIPRVCSCAR